MTIIVTDLTKFKNNNLVCLAGIDLETFKCIRPLLPNSFGGTTYLDFEYVKNHNIIPGSYLNANFLKRIEHKIPHSEDHLIENRILAVGEHATGQDFHRVLESTCSTTIAAGFGHNPVDKFYVENQAPNISIFTLKLPRPREQFKLILSDKFGPPSFKVSIKDDANFELPYLKVTDLGFANQLQRISTEHFGSLRLNTFLQSQEVLYLRIGLGQLFTPNNDPLKRGYYLQVNGIYSFPTFREDLRMYG